MNDINKARRISIILGIAFILAAALTIVIAAKTTHYTALITGITSTSRTHNKNGRSKYHERVSVTYKDNAGNEQYSNIYSVTTGTVPTAEGNITLTPMNNYNQLNGLFVQNLSWVKIEAQGTAYPDGGATINQYDLTSLGGYNSNVTKTNMPISNSKAIYEYTNKLQKNGNISATVYVYDTRGGYAYATSNSVNVIEYYNPSIQSLKVERCNSDGTLNNNGTSCKLTVNYNIAPINDGSNNKNTKALYYSLDGFNYVEILISNYSGTVTKVINDTTFNVAQSYPIYIRLQDINTIVNQTITLPTSFVLISKRTGGKGITFGAIAEQDNFHNYLDSYFHKDLFLDGSSLKPNIITATGGSYTTTTKDNEKYAFTESDGVGNKLTLSDGGVKIGSGVSYVKICAYAMFSTISGIDNRHNLYIFKNSSNQLTAINRLRGAWETIASTTVVIPVSTNDILYLYVRSQDNTGAVINSASLTVEVVK